MNEVKSDVEKLVQKELESANQRFPVFHSDYEGAAVIFEETEEAESEMRGVNRHFASTWYFVKQNERIKAYSYINKLKNSAVNLACEAIQVAAMAQKFIDSQKERDNHENHQFGWMF